MGTRRLIAISLVAVVMGALPSSAIAFTLSGQSIQDSSLSYCVESTPDDISVATAKARLDDAIAEWHTVPHKNSGNALDLVHHTTCQYGGVGATDYRLVAVPSGNFHGHADTVNGKIEFNDADPWWGGSGNRPADHFSYEGVLIHEMGHTFGIGHAGDSHWTYDTSTDLPTMAQCGPTPNEADEASEDFESLQQDDWGGGSWASNLSVDFFNANGGFEAGSTHWYRSNTSQITTGSAYKWRGSKGLRMTNSGNYIYMTTVYDPYFLDGPERSLVDGMDETPVFKIRVTRKHTQGSTTGGAKIDRRLEYIKYDNAGGCKVRAYEDTVLISGMDVAGISGGTP